ncbi:hypothetical protein KBC79_05155 [Candidatus Woesebacteria bacterium]|nr:hypothetical protein [Candidatus Woesebacteria bacterium]
MKHFLYLIVIVCLTAFTVAFQSYYAPKTEGKRVTVNIPTVSYSADVAMEFACGKRFYSSAIVDLGDGKYVSAEQEGVNVTLAGTKVYVLLEAGESGIIHANPEHFPSSQIAQLYFEKGLTRAYDIVYAEAHLNPDPDLTKLTNAATVSCITWTNRNLSIGAVGYLILAGVIAVFAMFAISYIMNSDNTIIDDDETSGY